MPVNRETADMQVFSDAVVLFSHIEEKAQLNRMLVENGLDVSGLMTESDTLENYFMERIGV